MYLYMNLELIFLLILDWILTIGGSRDHILSP
jgi:hypothetical protein